LRRLRFGVCCVLRVRRGRVCIRRFGGGCGCVWCEAQKGAETVAQRIECNAEGAPICYRSITSHHITSHHITAHHITPHHITPHHTTSHDIPQHTTSHSLKQRQRQRDGEREKRTDVRCNCVLMFLARLEFQSVANTQSAAPSIRGTAFAGAGAGSGAGAGAGVESDGALFASLAVVGAEAEAEVEVEAEAEAESAKGKRWALMSSHSSSLRDAIHSHT
jgi:hypothetical protein